MVSFLVLSTSRGPRGSHEHGFDAIIDVEMGGCDNLEMDVPG
jgi:hypothetical protein